jgi:hypothetical protein
MSLISSVTKKNSDSLNESGDITLELQLGDVIQNI